MVEHPGRWGIHPTAYSPDASRSFAWKRFNGNRDEISGVDSVEFGPAHVVFFDEDGKILRAVRVENVNDLEEVTP
ncbi:hypothetical protein SEA_JERA_44 [Microbacterium phage Jera]